MEVNCDDDDEHNDQNQNPGSSQNTILQALSTVNLIKHTCKKITDMK